MCSFGSALVLEWLINFVVGSTVVGFTLFALFKETQVVLLVLEEKTGSVCRIVLVDKVVKNFAIGGILGFDSRAGQSGRGVANGSPPLRCFCSLLPRQ